ncbi:apicortin, putative [Plasmodium berghei]|uniref:Apicortin, putative n=2 Tax=Plasmodium berghei TaxID=5821 RepID=A0A509AMB2_PLABA|nr:apicortin, putative [Plasmodium berghei ANKA]CXI80798.1 apicortin, putative [Plasmodium berghei]SCM25448.1 apicortin, putative [Plasmodium berghei]SCN27370.1 apicortin, putative [Plasmodium berghei]SCO62026.1 apicortin, putative [Plasmodium berghei]SCO63796.1 apicortin, putative [Plasmodium berghei]|eukprot:XP_034423003.1 apicortin, putative [Plasmodium berghei ANKA]
MNKILFPEIFPDIEENKFVPIQKYFSSPKDIFLTDFINNNEDNSLKSINNNMLHEKKRNKQYKSVFERLTDQNFYTGTHKKKFEALVKCKLNEQDMDNYLSINLEMHTNIKNENMISQYSFSSIGINQFENGKKKKKKEKNLVVTPGILGIQKYGIQIARPKSIWLYRNGDKHHNGLLFFIKSHINNFKLLLFEITKVLNPIIGPIRKIYDQNFRLIKNIQQLNDGSKYLCTSGDPPASIDHLGKFKSKWVIQG